MFAAIKNDEIGLGSIDFNKIIPMPEHIFVEISAWLNARSTQRQLVRLVDCQLGN